LLGSLPPQLGGRSCLSKVKHGFSTQNYFRFVANEAPRYSVGTEQCWLAGIFLTGKPCSGKSAFAYRLAQELQTYHVCVYIGGSADAMLLGSSRKWRKCGGNHPLRKYLQDLHGL